MLGLRKNYVIIESLRRSDLKFSVFALIIIFSGFAKKVKEVPKTKPGHLFKIISSNWETRKNNLDFSFLVYNI